MDNVQLAELYCALSAMFTECIARHTRCHKSSILMARSGRENRHEYFVARSVGRFLPPSSAPAGGNEARRTASSSEVPPHT